MSEMLEVNDSKGGDKAEEEIIKSVTASSFAGKLPLPFEIPHALTITHPQLRTTQ